MPTINFSGAKIFLTSVTVTLFVIALVIFVLMPLLAKIDRTNEEIHANNQEIAQIRAEIESHKKLAQEFQKIEQEHELLQSMFPPKEEMVILVEGLEDSADNAQLQHALNLLENNPNQGQVPGLVGIAGISYELSLLNGTYGQFIDFLIYLENQPFITKLESLSLSADSTQSEVSLINLGVGSAKIGGQLLVTQPPR